MGAGGLAYVATPAGTKKVSDALKAIAAKPGGLTNAVRDGAVKASAVLATPKGSRTEEQSRQPKMQGVVPSPKSITPTPISKAKQFTSTDPVDIAVEEAIRMKDGEAPLPQADDFTKLLKAVSLQESGGNPDAVSDAGAIGLHQIMPATAKDIAKELGVTKYDLKDPETNTIFAAHYLKKLLSMFGNDPELALAAYHSGPGRVKNLLKLHDGKTLSAIRPYLGPVGKQYASGVLSKLKKIDKYGSVKT
jgi:soluble lytic murein transglycosylase-like protein